MGRLKIRSTQITVRKFVITVRKITVKKYPFCFIPQKSESQKERRKSKTVKIDFQRSDFSYGVKKDHNFENQKDHLPMAYYLCVPRPVGVRLGSLRLG